MAYANTPSVVRDRPTNANTVGTGASLSGLKVLGEYGFGPLRCTTIGLTSASVTATRNSTTSAYGSQSLYTFPQSTIAVVGAFGRLTATRGETTNMTATAAFYYSIGTTAVVAGSAATNTDATTSTLVSIAPATLATMSGGTIAFNLSSIGAMTSLTDSSGGTASDTLAAISGTYSQSEVRNSVASLAAKINRLITFANAMRVVTVDGTSSAPQAYLNFSNSNSASAQIATGDSSLTLTGTVSLFWLNLGVSTANDNQP